MEFLKLEDLNGGDIWGDNFILIKEIVIDENCYFYLFNFLGKLVKENTD